MTELERKDAEHAWRVNGNNIIQYCNAVARRCKVDPEDVLSLTQEYFIGLWEKGDEEIMWLGYNRIKQLTIDYYRPRKNKMGRPIKGDFPTPKKLTLTELHKELNEDGQKVVEILLEMISLKQHQQKSEVLHQWLANLGWDRQRIVAGIHEVLEGISMAYRS